MKRLKGIENMINRINKITLYVNNPSEAKKFWIEKCKFMVRTEKDMGTEKWIEVAPQEDAGTVFILYDKKNIKNQYKSGPISHPSVTLVTRNIEQTINQLKQNGVHTGEIQDMPYGKMATFLDQDKNEYLLREN